MQFRRFNVAFTAIICLNYMSSIVKKLYLFCYIFLSLPFLSAEKFEFLFEDGEGYRINSFVDEDVYFNMKFSHTANITNRITVDISDVQKTPRPSALYTCNFMTSEKTTRGKTFSWAKQYPSVFRRDSLGYYEIGKEYFMPVVRNVPIFPDHDVKPGETWTGEGHEAHDFRTNFHLATPFIVPFEVQYTYVGTVQKDGKMQDLITAEYQLYYELPLELIVQNTEQTSFFPIRTLGTSKQNLYWDRELGNLSSYDESFTIRLIINNGDIYDFVGTAYAKVTALKNFNRKKTAEEVQKKLDDLKLENVVVKETDEGITISLEDIHFLPDSAILVESEKTKLDAIAEILKTYPERDLLITGHTALAGTKAEREQLSIERADAVASYLIERKVREAHRIFTKGYGAEQPVAPNDTEKNKAKNRRVEITIIDK